MSASNPPSSSQTCKPPALPPGVTQHHIVVLEAVHVSMPTFDFPHTITLHQRTAPSEVSSRIRDATIVIACVTPITPSDIDSAPHLRCIAVMAVGISWLDRQYCAKKGITVTNCHAGNVDAVGEHFLALYFGVRKRIAELNAAVIRKSEGSDKGAGGGSGSGSGSSEWVEKGTMIGRWGSDGPPLGCRQEVLGVLGYGNLGKRIASLAKAVGFGEVLISERKGTKRDGEMREGRTSFEDVLKRASTIVVCVPKEGDTIDLIAEEELKMMRKDAIVINVARGGIVNEAALARALRNRVIAGAATDVLETEPGGPGTSPLLPDVENGEEPVPNMLITPHLAWFTQSTIKNYQRMLKEGVEGFVNGNLIGEDNEPPPILVVHGGKVLR